MNNENTLLELQFEKNVLKQQKPRTPTEHREKVEKLLWVEDLIQLIKYVEKR